MTTVIAVLIAGKIAILRSLAQNLNKSNPMTSHQLARYLLECPDLPLVGMDGDTYTEIHSVHPVNLCRFEVNGEFKGGLTVPGNWSERQRADAYLVVM